MIDPKNFDQRNQLHFSLDTALPEANDDIEALFDYVDTLEAEADALRKHELGHGGCETCRDVGSERVRLAKLCDKMEEEQDALRKQLAEREKLFLQDAELCRKEIDGLRKQLEEARLEREKLSERCLEQVDKHVMFKRKAEELERRLEEARLEVERLREAIRTRPETYQYVVESEEASDELGVWHGEEFCFFCSGKMAGQQVNHKEGCMWKLTQSGGA